ncbi:O-antigen ligase family protein [Halobaculum halobium]
MLVNTGLAVALVAAGRSNQRRWFAASAIGVLLVGVLVSQSRATWMAAGVVIGLIAFRRITERYSLADLVAVVIVTALLTGPLAVLLARFLVAIEPATVFERIRVYRFALVVIADNLVLGVGFDGFRPLATPVGIDVAVHNLFLEIAVTTGLTGLALFLALFCRVARRGTQLLKNGDNILASAAPFALAAVILEAQFFRGVYSYELWIVFAVASGMFLRQTDHNDQNV